MIPPQKEALSIAAGETKRKVCFRKIHVDLRRGDVVATTVTLKYCMLSNRKRRTNGKSTPKVKLISPP
jgi:hypothetical protein